MPTYRFEEIERPVTKKTPCTGCGKKLTRSTTFTQTINPWNKDADGRQKTRRQILLELEAEAEAWAPVATCLPCQREPDVRRTATMVPA